MNEYRALLERTFGGRRWICAGAVVMEGVGMSRFIREAGGEALAIGGTRGAGEIPADLETIDLGLPPARSMMEAIHRSEAAMQALPAWAVERIDRFDPRREARAMVPIFSGLHEVAGRPVYGARDPRWTALEDKTRADAVWDAAGITRAPSAVIEPVAQAVADLWPALDRGFGLVIARDNSTGWHGGADGTRWARTTDEIAGVLAEIGAGAARVRVMPFLEGLPCSIHGWVLGDKVATFRPVEMVVLRVAGTSKLHYARAATFWEAEPALRDAMREAAHRVGAHLRDSVSFRGVFTVDGVATADGFLPTELNPRYGAGMSVMCKAIPDFHAYPIHLATIAGDADAIDAARLEADIVAGSLEHRSGGGMAMVPRKLEEQTLQLDCRDGAWSVSDREKGDATAIVGPSGVGSIVLCNLDPAATPHGPPVAGRVASALNFLDGHFDLGLGELQPAPETRSEG